MGGIWKGVILSGGGMKTWVKNKIKKFEACK